MLYALMLTIFSLFTPPAVSIKADYPSLVRISIVGPDKETNEISERGHGSGVIVGPHTIYTARHIGELKEGRSLKVSDQGGKEYTVTNVVLDPKNDFAVLTIKETIEIAAAAVSCTPVNTLDHLYVVGYPLNFPALVFELVTVDYIPSPKGTLLTATGVALPGDSGGPVFNSDGEVVGILVGEFMTGDSPFSTSETDLNTIVPMTEVSACKAVT